MVLTWRRGEGPGARPAAGSPRHLPAMAHRAWTAPAIRCNWSMAPSPPPRAGCAGARLKCGKVSRRPARSSARLGASEALEELHGCPGNLWAWNRDHAAGGAG